MDPFSHEHTPTELNHRESLTQYELLAWEHYCRTGCILPGYSTVIAKQMAASNRRT